MTDFVMKILELEQRINCEFDVFKNFYRDTFGTDPNNLDTLLTKIKNEIDQVKQKQSMETINQKKNVYRINKENVGQNTDVLIKSQALKTLKELQDKIITEFHTFKSYNVNYGTGQINPKNLDTILFKVQFQIDEMKNDIHGRNSDYNQFKNVETTKANALIRLQTLANLITCHIIKLDNNL